MAQDGWAFHRYPSLPASSFQPLAEKRRKGKKNEKSHQGFGSLTGYPKLMASFQKQKTLKDSEAPAPSKVGTIHILHDDVEFPSESKGILHLELNSSLHPMPSLINID